MPLLDTRKQKDLLGTLISDLVLSLLSYVAETERSFIRERQREGIEAAHRRGIKFGRPPAELPCNFHASAQAWKSHELSLSQAARACGMAKSTFWEKAREIKETE
ncbi:MAG: recombinase family protein [Treponema sp.]|nr:recombinase family protein [Treponema sp.]